MRPGRRHVVPPCPRGENAPARASYRDVPNRALTPAGEGSVTSNPILGNDTGTVGRSLAGVRLRASVSDSVVEAVASEKPERRGPCPHTETLVAIRGDKSAGRFARELVIVGLGANACRGAIVRRRARATRTTRVPVGCYRRSLAIGLPDRHVLATQRGRGG